LKLEDFLAILPENYTVIDRESIARAYHFAEKAHEGQKRASGEPYVTHCVAVATILAEDMRLPPAVTIAGLLHDTVEDTSVTLDDIRKEFGNEVAQLVDGVTKLTNLPRVQRGDQHLEDAQSTGNTGSFPAITGYDPSDPRGNKAILRNETLRKTFLAMSDDIRVVLIKLADRLHNMRTLGHMPESKRTRIAKETLDIFAPLANRLGIWRIKWELEDLSFRYINPEKYKEIAEYLSERRTDREGQIQNIIVSIKSKLETSGIHADITGRPKHIYSIYRKMVDKGRPVELVRDLRGVRLIVPDIPSCYATLGVIHTHWRPIPSEFDDYIAAPKDNSYKSIHTAVIYDDGKPLEVQIRTPEMNQEAELGIAAHWRYKERSSKRDEAYEQRINWLRKLMDWRQEVENANQFVERMKTDVFQDRIYVFTPRGDIIDLPAGSTPIDFAYQVHTEIGNRCRGARVNGKLVPLDYSLKTGDQVDIITAKQGGPSRDWLNPNLGLVRTQRALSKIRQWFKRQDREQNLSQGKLILEREIRRLGLQNVDIEALGLAFNYPTPEELFVALGCGDITIAKVINNLHEATPESDQILLRKPQELPQPVDDAVMVLGLKGLLINYAHCCNPTPPDPIVGYITRGRGATIHRSDCPNMLRSKDKERVVKVSWGEPRQTFPVPILVRAYDRQGLLSDITTILNEEGINMLDVSLRVNNNLADIHLILELNDLTQLSRVLTRIENLPNVMEANRLRPG
jgi:GTP pyrophosphokinase